MFPVCHDYHTLIVVVTVSLRSETCDHETDNSEVIRDNLQATGKTHNVLFQSLYVVTGLEYSISSITLLWGVQFYLQSSVGEASSVPVT